MNQKYNSKQLKFVYDNSLDIQKNVISEVGNFNIEKEYKTSWKNIKAILDSDNALKNQEDLKVISEDKNLSDNVLHDFKIIRKRNLSQEKEKFLNRIRYKISKDYYILHVTVKYNNVFCILTDNKKKTISRVRSSGNFGMKISKKNLKYSLDFFIKQYRKLLIEKGIVLTNTVAIKLNCSRKYKKTLLKTIKSVFFTDLSFNKTALIVDIKSGKPFNGCRGVKLRRKKRFKPRVYKVTA